MVKALILAGYGINCDYETKHAFELAGAQAEKVHVNELINKEKSLEDYQIIAFPGGFSYADDLGSGRVLATKLKTHLDKELKQFISDDKLMIGICNGFQVMVKYPLIPSMDSGDITLTFNDSGRFEDRWVYMKKVNSNCVWTKGINEVYFPVRHAEGKLIARDEKALKSLYEKDLVVFKYIDEGGKEKGYPWNPNGSVDNIAGICDESGRIFGLMPHPEAYLYPFNHPRWTGEKTPSEGMGLQIFKNAVAEASKL